jgi:hypothetical protein
MTQDASSLPEQEGLIPLPIPVPPSLEGALGYDGEGRFLALWWESAADEAIWSDGRPLPTPGGMDFWLTCNTLW